MNNLKMLYNNWKKPLVITKHSIYQATLLRLTLFLALFFGLNAVSFAQTSRKQQSEKPLNRILFIFDASNSMNTNWGEDTRFALAKKLLANAIEELRPKQDVEVALRVYGHKSNINTGPQDCEDTELVVGFSKNNHNEILSAVKRVKALGTTPIARSLEKSADDFPDCDNCRNIIILITDGIEACDGDPCAVARALQSKNIVLKPFIIGIGMDTEYLNAFDCIGTYYDAQNAGVFKQILEVVITQALNPTTVQFNLLSTANKPIETNVVLSLYDQLTGVLLDQFVHTLNHRGFPDTLSIESAVLYRVVAHTFPQVIKDSVIIENGIHNIIPLNTPQGSLRLMYKDHSDEKLSALVRQKGKSEILIVQDLNTTQKLLTGYYDIEVLTKPTLLIEGVQINQSHTTKVEIPVPGALTINCTTQGFGSVLAIKTDGSEEKIFDITPEQSLYSFKLQPGDYRAVFRSRNTQQTLYTKTVEFTIKSSKTTTVKLP
jgi:Ca-activated chloride channel family protein